MIFSQKKLSSPSKFGVVLVKFASAQVASNFLRMLAGFFVISLIAPELYGQFTGVGVYLGYILLGHGGIINGLSRELPYELGRGNDDYAREMASSVFVLSLLISIIASLIFLGFALINLLRGDFLAGLIFFAYSIIGAFHLLNKQFLPTLYRTNKDFDSLSRQNILTGIGNLFTVLLVWGFGIYGLIARGVILAIYELKLLFKNKAYQLNLKYNTEHYKKLFKTGLPIFMVGQVNPLWSTLLNNFIFSVGGALNFGLYALSNIIQGAIGVIPHSFSQVIYPRMSIMLGEGKSVSEIIKANIKPLILQFGVILSIAVAGMLILPLIIPVVLPKYVAGVEAAQWMCFVPVALSFGALNNLYNVVKKQKWYFVSLMTGVLIGTGFITIMIKQHGFYLEIFPQGLLLGTIIQQIMSLLFLGKLRKE